MVAVSKRDAKEEKARRVLQRNFTAYKRYIFRRYHHAPHLELLDTALEYIVDYVDSGGIEGIGCLLIEEPPRHGKTLTLSRLFPTWVLGRNPDHRAMLVSYGHSLANKNSRMARNILNSPWYKTIFPGVELAHDSAASNAWDIKNYEGGCDALGVLGAATGLGCQYLIIDDAVKNRQEAESQVYRDRTWDAYTNDLYTRVEPGGAKIVNATRWHKDDLTGRIIANSAVIDWLDWLEQGKPLVADDGDEIWVRISLPAIAEENDALGREVGEALWPWRYPKQALKKIAKAVGRYAWAALYQQRPAPRAGGIFKWEDIDGHRVVSKNMPELIRVGVALDPSGSSTGDEVGIVAAGLSRDGHVYVLQDATLQASPDQWARTTVVVYNKHLADFLVGEKNFGGDMVELTIRTVDKNIHYIPVTASRGKELRAEPVSALYEQGLIHHVGDEFAELEDEMTTWKPGADSPNRMDALVFVITELVLNEHGDADWLTIPGWGDYRG